MPTPIDNLTLVSPALANDYNVIRPYIDSDTMVNQNMDSLFTRNREYRYLQLESGQIDNVLSSAVLGANLEFHFTSQPSGRRPTMTIGTNVYTLWRSATNASPVPNRYFVNHADLRDAENIRPQINADVADNSGLRDLVYAAMFIVAVGRDPGTYARVYSTPTLIHIFLLPS